jgi:hypothetical protein
MSQADGGESSKGLARVKLFAAAVGATAEGLLDIAGANDFLQSLAGAGVAAETESVLASRLSRRERWNAVTVARRAIERAGQRCLDGEVPREDGFLVGAPSSFQEAVDGALITAQRNYESRKLQYLGNLVASFALDTSIDSVTANWCIRMAESLSWTQYVLLALATEDRSEYGRVEIYPGRDRMVNDPTAWTVWEDWEDLHSRRLVGMEHDDLHYRRNDQPIPTPYMGWTLIYSGRLLVRHMELSMIGPDERDPVYAALVKGALPPT